MENKPKYRNILSGYVNQREDGSAYLAITNLTDEDFVIPAGQKLFMNRTPADRLAANPKIPHYSKSIKIEETLTDADRGDISLTIPF